jgi:hypothetical protein
MANFRSAAVEICGRFQERKQLVVLSESAVTCITESPFVTCLTALVPLEIFLVLLCKCNSDTNAVTLTTMTISIVTLQRQRIIPVKELSSYHCICRGITDRHLVGVIAKSVK